MAAVAQSVGEELTDLLDDLPTLPVPAAVLDAQTAFGTTIAIATSSGSDVLPLNDRRKPDLAYEPCPALRAFSLNYRTSIAVLAPSVGSVQAGGFVGQLARLAVQPELETGHCDGVRVLESREQDGICVTDFDPGPALQVRLHFQRISLAGLRRLYGSSVAGSSEEPLTGAEFETLCKRNYFTYRSETCTRVRVGPVRLTDRGIGLMQLFRLQAQGAPHAEFDTQGHLLQLTVQARAVQSPTDARRTDAALGLCGEVVTLARTRIERHA